MRWEERILGLIDDLEQQAEGLALAERDALVAQQSRAEYAEVDLAARLHATVGRTVVVDVAGVGALQATLTRAGEGWLLLDREGQSWIVTVAAVRSLRGLAEGGVGAGARPVLARLGLGSALREVAEAGCETVLHWSHGTVSRGRLERVGRDFVELAAPAEPGDGSVRRVQVVPFSALAAVRSD